MTLTTSLSTELTSTSAYDTRQTARNLGDLNQMSLTWRDRVSASDTNDYFKFRFDSAASLDVQLTNLQADADLYLLDSQGRTIAQSLKFGTLSESLSLTNLAAGIYYIQVNSFLGAQTDYTLTAQGGGLARDPGFDWVTARDLGDVSGSLVTIQESAGASDPIDYYRIDLSETGVIDLKMSGLTSDLDVYLFNQNGTLVAASNRFNADDEAISLTLNAGTYYVRVTPWSGSSAYSLSVTSRASKTISQPQVLQGTLGADTFSLGSLGMPLPGANLGPRRTIVSGNGNVDFGQSRWDLLDLSTLRSTDVWLNLTTATSGGLLYDPGNGSRLFDAILLSNGSEILFEGIDRIQFSDMTYSLSQTTNDPLFNRQWNLHMMGVHNAWRFGTGSQQVMVGVQDTGLGLSRTGAIHNDLRNTWIYENNFADDYFRNVPDESFGPRNFSHGTAVQSIIAASSNNGIGMSGINWNSEIFTIDVIDNNTGDQSLFAATQNMINEANRFGRRLVINFSLGGGGIDPAFRSLVANNQSNALFVISAGNDDLNRLGNPASLAIEFSNVIAVGASWGRRDRFGNPSTPGDRISYPGWWGSNYGTGLTLMAPSEVVAATANRNAAGIVNFDYMSTFNGTSAAAPNAAGVASLVWSANPLLSATQVQQILSQTAFDLGSRGYDNLTGNGFVNADAAVRRALAIGRGASA